MPIGEAYASPRACRDPGWVPAEVIAIDAVVASALERHGTTSAGNAGTGVKA